MLIFSGIFSSENKCTTTTTTTTKKSISKFPKKNNKPERRMKSILYDLLFYLFYHPQNQYLQHAKYYKNCILIASSSLRSVVQFYLLLLDSLSSYFTHNAVIFLCSSLNICIYYYQLRICTQFLPFSN